MKLFPRILIAFALATPTGACMPEGEVSGGTGGSSATGSGGSGGSQTGSGGSASGSGGSGSGGTTGSGGATGSGGSGTGGTPYDGGSGSGGSATDGGVDRGATDVRADTPVSSGDVAGLPRFSFFVTSIGAMRRLSKSQDGFGGDLRYGETTGLAGADKICREIAETAMPGAGAKTWRAFLSTVAGPVHAIDRIGEGPWYDRMGRVVAMTKAAITNARPMGADPAIINDLPNENGIPNHTDGMPGCTGNACPDNHDILTGTGPMGRLYSMQMSNTCNDWTSAEAVNPGGRGRGPWCGHSWPRTGSGVNWMSALAEGGCGPGVNLREQGGPLPGVYNVGTGGGYGGIYCFALTP